MSKFISVLSFYCLWVTPIHGSISDPNHILPDDLVWNQRSYINECLIRGKSAEDLGDVQQARNAYYKYLLLRGQENFHPIDSKVLYENKTADDFVDRHRNQINKKWDLSLKNSLPEKLPVKKNRITKKIRLPKSERKKIGPSLEQLILRAEKAESQARYALARRYYSQILRKDPSRVDIQEKLKICEKLMDVE